jgi:hypothetical protein
MHRLAWALSLLGISLTTLSCEEDFEVNAPYEEIYIVYGLLDIGDTQHEIRIQRAFQNPEVSATTVAQRPDSLYPPENIEVYLIEKEPIERTFDTIVDTIPMVRTRLETKEAGLFTTEGHVVYTNRGERSLKQAALYELSIINRAKSYRLGSSAPLVGESSFNSPREGDNFDFRRNPQVPPILRIQPPPNLDDQNLDKSVRVFYEERPVNSEQAWRRRIVEFEIRESNNRLPEGVLFDELQNRVQQNPNVERRVLDSVVFAAAAAGEELERYIDLSQISTGPVENTPEYTNIRNGFGVFSSRSEAVTWVRFNDSSRVQLLEGTQTGALFDRFAP